jgi:transketolase
MAYGALGYSHHAVQDLAILRTLPELTILSPADPGEARACVEWLAAHPCPSYLRLGKAGEPVLHQAGRLAPEPRQVVAGQSDCALVATGSILKVAMEAACLLAGQGLSVSVFSCPWLQPVTPDSFRSLGGFRQLVVVEEHVAAGGLASLLRENLGAGPQICSLAVAPAVLNMVGSQEFLRREGGIDAPSVVKAVLRASGKP